MAKVVFDHTKKILHEAINLSPVKAENRTNKIKKILKEGMGKKRNSVIIEEVYKECKKDDEMLLFIIVFAIRRMLP